ncbi:hypothetical protein B0T26DRAFT_84218 [Lasiosphaeria miniovina]|uniref:Uncharacterized protein n=1 Tax=Lasiosphaeria miniovina TaxID=1954250 RepID=A0AA40BIJ3_9PEZI|nr:uncharacterized protein B0T26DRAFT_84218 [Lasiosphaeria miniovina]KAK0734862.1 hypothetical protein B0T26DRAFT_84218 [Lasiosphaeria miniovina]
MNGSMGHVGTTRVDAFMKSIEKGGVCLVCTGVAFLSTLGLLRIELFEGTQHNHQPISLLAMISRACDLCCRRCTGSFLQTTQRSKQQTSFFLRHEIERQMREREVRKSVAVAFRRPMAVHFPCWGRFGRGRQTAAGSHRIPHPIVGTPPTAHWNQAGRVRLGIAGILNGWIDSWCTCMRANMHAMHERSEGRIIHSHVLLGRRNHPPAGHCTISNGLLACRSP